MDLRLHLRSGRGREACSCSAVRLLKRRRKVSPPSSRRDAARQRDRRGFMSVFHDEVEIEDFEFDEDSDTYYFPCPCGDKFAITKVVL